MTKLTTAKIKNAISQLKESDLPFLIAQDEAYCYNQVPASNWIRLKKVTDGAGRTVRSFRDKHNDHPVVVVSDSTDENILGIYCDAYGYFMDPEDIVALKDSTQPWKPPTCPNDFVFIFTHQGSALGPMVYITPKLMFDNEGRVADQSWANGFLTICGNGMDVLSTQGLYEESESLYSWDVSDLSQEEKDKEGITKELCSEDDVRAFLLSLGLTERVFKDD
jgi:hypothetical protein